VVGGGGGFIYLCYLNLSGTAVTNFIVANGGNGGNGGKITGSNVTGSNGGSGGARRSGSPG
jgi:hypothetical protein